MYTVMLLLRVFSGKPRLYGLIMKDGKPLAYAIVRVTQDGIEVASRVTDLYGRYISLLKPGTYELTVEERISEDQYQTVLRRAVHSRDGALSKRISIKG